MSIGPTSYGPITSGVLRKALIGWTWEAEGWGSDRRHGWALTKEAAERHRDIALAEMKPQADEVVESLREHHREQAKLRRRFQRRYN